MINYNYCQDAYYDVIDETYQRLKSIIKKVEDNEISYGYLGTPEKIIPLNEVSKNAGISYLPGIQTSKYKNYLDYENQMCDYFRKYVASIIDENGKIINVERNKIDRHCLPNDEVEYLYDGIIIQEEGINKLLWHGGLKNALIHEYNKAYQRK